MAGLALAAFLLFGALDRMRVGAAESNTDFVLSQLRGSIESSLSLGLSLSEVQIAQDLVERAKAGNPEILAIEVFSPAGISLFNTDRGGVGEPITDVWHEARRRSSGRWRTEEFGGLIIGEEIYNDFGEPVGGIAITLSGTARQVDANTTTLTLLAWLALVSVPSMIGISLVATWLLNGSTRDLRWAAGLLAASENADTQNASAATPDLVTVAESMRAHIDGTIEKANEAARAVGALDDDEAKDAVA